MPDLDLTPIRGRLDAYFADPQAFYGGVRDMRDPVVAFHFYAPDDLAALLAEVEALRLRVAEVEQERDSLLTDLHRASAAERDALERALAAYLVAEDEGRERDEARALARTLLSCARSGDVQPQDLPEWMGVDRG